MTRPAPSTRLQLEAGVAPVPYAAVFDGHGGFACAEWLVENLQKYLAKHWEGGVAPQAAVTQAFVQADKRVGGC